MPLNLRIYAIHGMIVVFAEKDVDCEGPPLVYLGTEASHTEGFDGMTTLQQEVILDKYTEVSYIADELTLIWELHYRDEHPSDDRTFRGKAWEICCPARKHLIPSEMLSPFVQISVWDNVAAPIPFEYSTPPVKKGPKSSPVSDRVLRSFTQIKPNLFK
ncbi:hypothetical protein T492DRAFT_847163 [Pavlovales sp. CCMP2436]|nr:hypothetical protein T492DRAFT_847163 [Pavlovales sp. CCMP2436]